MSEVNELAETLTVRSPSGAGCFTDHILESDTWRKEHVLKMVLEHLAQDKGVSPDQRCAILDVLSEHFPDSHLVEPLEGQAISPAPALE